MRSPTRAESSTCMRLCSPRCSRAPLPIQLLIRQASDDAAIVEVWKGIRFGRLMGMTDLATNLAEGGHLRDGVTPDAARDILWAYSSPELFELLVIERGWPTDRYATFVEAGTAAGLLSPR